MAGPIFADTGANQIGREDIKMARCPWCLGNEKMIRYHDEEWGVPVHEDRKQFEFLMMEVMQCSLNWNMMIHKRDGKWRHWRGAGWRDLWKYRRCQRVRKPQREAECWRQSCG